MITKFWWGNLLEDRSCYDSFKMDLRDADCVCKKWMQLAQDHIRWHVQISQRLTNTRIWHRANYPNYECDAHSLEQETEGYGRGTH